MIDGIHGYFLWLKEQIAPFPGEYNFLIEQLYSTAFIPLVDYDENRMADGYELADNFYGYIPAHTHCSFLEMLIALGLRADLIGSELGIADSGAEWFWLMLRNAGLLVFTDEMYISTDYPQEGVAVILNTINNRRYGTDGYGGFFPLRNGKENQRKVELWAQLGAYIVENSDIAL